MKNPLRSFGVRVTLAIVISMVTIIFIKDTISYQIIAKEQQERLRTVLKAIAQTAASMIDSQTLNAIPLDKEGINTQAYQHISDQVRRMKEANGQIEYIYILKPSNNNIWQFIVDINGPKSNALPGQEYNAGRFSEMLKGANAPSADLKLEEDEWGKNLSGYAPIRDTAGKVVAVLGVDMDASNVFKIQNHVRQTSLKVLLISILLAILLGFLISNRVLGPINKLRTGIEYINEGHWHHQVRVIGDDEIAQLARSFNEMAKGLHDSRERLLNYFYDSVKSLVMLLEARDHYTLGHSEAVAFYSEKIALRMGMDQKLVEYFKRVVLLHDIGKVGVRDNILLKTDVLDDHEWNVIKLHPVLGEQILKPILDDPLMLSVIRNHHERYDGKGYPDGWTKEQIPLMVAIVTVADSYDAMTSNRSYRKAMSKDKAVEQLVNNRGSQFNPDVVDVFLTILREEEEGRLENNA